MTTCTSMFGVHHRLAEIALRHVTDWVAPKILDLASGNGGLSRRLLDKHPSIEVTVTDLDPMVVGNLTLSDLGNHPRALVCDATAIDAPNGPVLTGEISPQDHSEIMPLTAENNTAEVVLRRPPSTKRHLPST